jgi:hypothetical protein
MKTQLKQFSQLILTGIGLFLLALALALNHYYPRNEGVSMPSKQTTTITTASAADSKN